MKPGAGQITDSQSNGLKRNRYGFWTALDGSGRLCDHHNVPDFIDFWTAWTAWTASFLFLDKGSYLYEASTAVRARSPHREVAASTGNRGRKPSKPSNAVEIVRDQWHGGRSHADQHRPRAVQLTDISIDWPRTHAPHAFLGARTVPNGS
jgi:hypothetical protein